MKKLFMLLALIVGVVSCQNDPEGFGVVVGGEQDVNITVSLPESTRAASNVGFDFTNFDRNGKYDLRFILEISYNGNVVREVQTTETTSATFPVRLAPNKDYTFTVWADLVNEGSEDDLYYNILTEDENGDVPGLSNITFKNWTPNVEARDAYTLSKKITFNAGADLSMELKRPFAKVRVVATDYKDIHKFGIEPTNAKVEYTSELYKSFNAVEGTVGSTTTKTHTFYYNDVDTYTDATGQMTVFADYILVPASGGTVQFKLDVNAANGLIKSNSFNTAIPVEANKVTSIVGDVLTEGGNVSIKIDGALGQKETINYVDTAESLQEIINNIEDGGSANIELGGDVNLDDLLSAGLLSATRAEKQYGLMIPAGKSVVLDLNGKRIYQAKECTDSYSMILNNGNLTITGNGTIEFTNTATGGSSSWGTYTIENRGDAAVLTIDNATILHNGCENGEVEHDTNIAIQNYQGKVVVNEGTISSPQFRSLRDFTAGGEIIINGGTFLGQVWMQGLGNGSSSLTINGGNFSPVAGYDGSSVYITNSGNVVNVAVNGGMFNTKIGCYDATKEGAKGCITGGTFTTAAKENTNAALLANGYVFVESENGNYTVENTGHYTDAEGNYYITNAKGLAWVSENVNTMEFYGSGSANIFDNVTVYLANDIDLGGAEWRPIGDYSFSRTSFNGVFDGQGYTVSNFKVTEPVRWTEEVTKASYGFFGNVKGTIKNLTIQNATVNPDGGRYSAALVGRLHNGGCIENCHVENSSVTILHWQVGGLVGQNNNGNISGCSVVDSTITGMAAVGAIVGMDMTAGEHTIENCRVANTSLVQNESFGASYDASYGLAVGLVNVSGIVLNIKDVIAENNTIKGVADNTLVGDIETGATVTINGVSIATTAEQLVAAIKDGKNVILGADIEIDSTIKVANDQTVTIDLNGHNITSKIAGKPSSFELFSVNGEVEIKGNGTISLTSEDFEWNTSYRYTAINIREKGVVTLGNGVRVICEASKDGSYGMSYAVDIYTTGKLTINGASLHSNYIAVRCFYGNSVVNVNSGSKITSSKNNYGIWLQSSPGAVVTIADDVNHTFENDIYYFN